MNETDHSRDYDEIILLQLSIQVFTLNWKNKTQSLTKISATH